MESCSRPCETWSLCKGLAKRSLAVPFIVDAGGAEMPLIMFQAWRAEPAVASKCGDGKLPARDGPHQRRAGFWPLRLQSPSHRLPNSPPGAFGAEAEQPDSRPSTTAEPQASLQCLPLLCEPRLERFASYLQFLLLLLAVQQQQKLRHSRRHTRRGLTRDLLPGI